MCRSAKRSPPCGPDPYNGSDNPSNGGLDQTIKDLARSVIGRGAWKYLSRWGLIFRQNSRTTDLDLDKWRWINFNRYLIRNILPQS